METNGLQSSQQNNGQNAGQNVKSPGAQTPRQPQQPPKTGVPNEGEGVKLTKEEHSLQPEQPEEKKKRKKLLLLLLLLLLLIGLAGGGIAAAFLLRPTEVDAVVHVGFDPLLWSEQYRPIPGGAENFDMRLSDTPQYTTQNVNQNVLEDQYLCFHYSLLNDGPKEVSWALSLEELENNGFDITYCLGDVNNPVDHIIGQNTTVSSQEGLRPGATEEIWVFFRVDTLNPPVSGNPSISGSLILTISIV